MMPVSLSLPEARRLALDSQGFGRRPTGVSSAHIRKLAARLHAFQIDSVSVLVRAHYVQAFARLGPYAMESLDSLAYRKRELFEYWGHAACLMQISLYPLVRYRMYKHLERTQEYMRSNGGAYMASVYAEVTERGPLSAAELSSPGKRSGGWWGWWGSGNGKATLEHLYDAGLVAIAGRRGFERLYDITERVVPRAAPDAPAPPREEAMKQLICLAAKAYGVGTLGDVTGYFNVDGWHDRLPPGPRWIRPKGSKERRARPIAKRLVSELVEEKRLIPARVEGWKEQAYLHPQARVPRTIDARGFVTAFDSLVWERSRMERIFGMKYTIEMYVPEPKRVYGYYVCPFLLGVTLVARCDLKADRARKILIVQSAFLSAAAMAAASSQIWLASFDECRLGSNLTASKLVTAVTSPRCCAGAWDTVAADNVNKRSLEMATIQKTAIVTGASQGIGAALVEAFLKRGYSVVANSRNVTKANPFPASPNLALVDGDIGDPKTAAKIVDTAVSRFGRIDVLINNAGIFIPKPFTEYTTEDLNALVSTTIAGFFYVSQLSVKQMLSQKSGSIVNVSTTLVDQPVVGAPAAVQVMAKGSLNAVTRALAIEYAKDGIRVNTVALGVINTPMHKPETHGLLKELHPVGRMGEIQEVVDAVLFLTDATFTTGEVLHVDGGAHAGKW